MSGPLAPGDRRRARFLIPDTTPLSLLGLIGPAALDWLFVPGADVWITDMVEIEATREPGPGADRRDAHRAAISAWLAANHRRIGVQPTREGREFRKAMRAWEMAGRPPELMPDTAGRGERSILDVLAAAEDALSGGEAVVVITDDRRARAALRAVGTLDIDILGTESFIDWMADTFRIAGADTAWQTIRAAAGGKAPVLTGDDPIYVRKDA